MKNYIVYDINSGQILKTGSCADNDFSLQGSYLIEGIADDSSQYIEDGIILNMPPKPGKYYIFDYKTKTWFEDISLAKSEVNLLRNSLLAESDWTQLIDVVLPNKSEWAAYRQELRDITQQSGYPFNVIWPTKPE